MSRRKRQRTVKVWLGDSAFLGLPGPNYTKDFKAPDTPLGWVLTDVKVHINKIVFYYDPQGQV